MSFFDCAVCESSGAARHTLGSGVNLCPDCRKHLESYGRQLMGASALTSYGAAIGNALRGGQWTDDELPELWALESRVRTARLIRQESPWVDHWAPERAFVRLSEVLRIVAAAGCDCDGVEFYICGACSAAESLRAEYRAGKLDDHEAVRLLLREGRSRELRQAFEATHSETAAQGRYRAAAWQFTANLFAMAANALKRSGTRIMEAAALDTEEGTE